jgi:ADP-heptose:LPS heptosyltransferase
MRKRFRVSGSDDKHRQLQMAWNLAAYVWSYAVRRGPSAVYRRMQFLKDRRRVIAEAHVANGFLVAVQTAGGIGDQVIIARLLRDVSAQFPDMRFDVFSNDLGITRWAFGKNPSFRQAYIDSLFATAVANYDYAVAVSDTITEFSNRSEKGRSQRQGFEALLDRATLYNKANEDIFSLGSRGRTIQAIRLVCDNATRHTALHHIAGIAYGGDEMAMECDPALLQATGIDRHKYITIHTGFGTDQVTLGRRSTKCYPHFDAVIALMRTKRPELVFVQLGARNSEPLMEADFRLLGNTTMPQVGALSAGAVLHMDNESGLVHIARCFGTRSCVVFGPTNPDYFNYEANVAIRPSACGGCWWITQDWMNLCPRGFAAPICTDWSSPGKVCDVALQMLAQDGPIEQNIIPLQQILGDS